MNYQFKIIPNDDLDQIIPLVYELNDAKVSEEILKSRFNEMRYQNYECAAVFNGDDLKLLGCGFAQDTMLVNL